ncbi:AhpC/TSA family protein [Pedobacter hiemivivus]|uniref:AhpC/TSA family protein n=1 Tax=Pedobacter hiemivivus TaxID=2530454 RepID=A0A4U1GIB9_9SPHI|nr:TlpA disulfide reductase family protein [Pedobacter hiemivivus]TKC63991.1 AhpC/TSA family protein [Pedobacter hiemivivus]
MKRIYLLFALLSPLLATAQSGKYRVYGKTDLPVDGKVRLHWYNINSGKHVDSATVTDGKFEFTGTMKEVEFGQLIFRSGSSDRSAVFYLEPGTIHVDIMAGTRYGKLSGTPLNNDYQQYYQMLDTMLTRINIGREGKRPYDQFSNDIPAEKLNILTQYIKTHKASKVSIDQLNMFAAKNPHPVALTALLGELSPALKKSEAGMALASRIKGMRSGKIGDMTLPFSLPDTAGRMVKLTDFRGKYVLLDFWATWCIPCIAEMPNVINAWNTYKNKNFTVVGVSLDRPDSKERWLKMIRESKYNWTQLSDLKFWNCEAALLYNVNSVPANFLIDPKGIIIATNLRGEALQKKLSEIFQ